MKHSKDGFLRIPFVVARSNKKAREWFRGAMLYVHRNPSWYLRIFEIDGRSTKGERVLDFGNQCPDGVIACGIPYRYIRLALKARGYENVPIVCVPQAPIKDEPLLGTAAFDVADISRAACDLFKKRGCEHVAYVGAHAPTEVRMSRALRRSFAAEAEKLHMTFSAVLRKISSSYGVQVTDAPDLTKWLRSLPKPCGILTWNDGIGRDILDLCRGFGINVPGEAYVLSIDDNALMCENSFPTLSSIVVDYERAGFEAAKLLNDLIFNQQPDSRHLVCGVRGITERASTQDPKGSGRLVALAREFIAKKACEDSALNQNLIAAHLGVSVRTLQLRFKESKFERTILQEIHHVRLARVRWLLVHSDKSIADITYLAGFRSQSRLKALFQTQFGMSMSDYRKNARGAQ